MYKVRNNSVERDDNIWKVAVSHVWQAPITTNTGTGIVSLGCHLIQPSVRLQNLPWSKTGLVSRQVLHPLSKLQNWIWSKTGRYKTGLVSNTKIEASLRATKPKPWQSNLTSDTVEIFIQNEKAGLVPMQSRFRSRHKVGFGAAGLGTAQSWFWSRHKAGLVSRQILHLLSKLQNWICPKTGQYKTCIVSNTKIDWLCVYKYI